MPTDKRVVGKQRKHRTHTYSKVRLNDVQRTIINDALQVAEKQNAEDAKAISEKHPRIAQTLQDAATNARDLREKLLGAPFVYFAEPLARGTAGASGGNKQPLMMRAAG